MMTAARKAALQFREVRIQGDVAYVPLTMGYEAVIDADDVRFVCGWTWCAMVKKRKDGTIAAIYAKRWSAQGTVLMHRFIAAGQSSLHVDHIDGDGLNNRRSNLRLANNQQNLWNRGATRANRSGRKGVSWAADRCKWVAQIKVGGRSFSLGYYDDVDAAGDAYDAASRRMHGVFSLTDKGRRMLHGDEK